MNARLSRLTFGLVAVLLAAALAGPAYAGEPRFTLTRAVPNDVFVCTAEQHNPEREFLDHYWGEVFDALKQCGLGADLMELIGSAVGEEGAAEVERLKQRATELLAGVDWDQLAGKEMVFAERLATPIRAAGNGPPVMVPDMVFLFRGSAEGAARNFDGLVAILQAVVEEINQAAGSNVLTVEAAPRQGAKTASVNVLAMAPGAPPLPITVAQRDDVVLITVGKRMLADVLGLLDGSASGKALSENPRFKAAFAQLPPAEDSMTFFDMQALLKSLRGWIDQVAAIAQGPGDVVRNASTSAEGNKLNGQALAAYQKGDVKQALTLIQQAHDVAPTDSIVLYNLACFNALLGNRTEALTWLEKAVEGGFYSPGKIAEDSDLVSLRGDGRYRAALAKAADLAAQHSAKDVVINSVKTGPAFELCTQAWKAYEDNDYQRGMELVDQAYELAPGDSRVLYYLACFHALLGREDKAAGLLQQAVDGGFYCPRHIAKDPDLECLRGDKRYEAALAKASEKAAELCAQKTAKETGMIKGIIGRLTNAVGIMDYVAVVESTEGYSVRTESIAVLVPDAESRPIYPVFAKGGRLTDFERYLPQETMSFSVGGGIDLGELYKFIEGTVRITGPKGEEMLAHWAQIQEELGINVRKDVIGWIDGGYVTVSLEDGIGGVFMIKVTDGEIAREKVAAAIDFLATKLPEIAAQNPMFAMMAIRKSPILDERLEGFEGVAFGMMPQPAVWGVTDDYLVFGSTADAVALCLETASGKHPNIRKNERVMSEAILPQGPFACVGLADKRALGKELAMGINIGSMVAGMAAMAAPADVQPVIARIAGMLSKLGPVVSKIDFYKSTATHTTFDGHAWHTHAVTHYVAPSERVASQAQ